jgi:S1-C subfamily serine protease
LNPRFGIAIYRAATQPGKLMLVRHLAPLAVAISLASAPAFAQTELTEQRRIEVARRLQESTVSVIAGPSSGTGFVTGDERWIVTNSHVIRPGRRYGVRVHFASGTTMEADVLLDSPQHDLAVLEVRGRVPSRPLPLGDSADVVVGQTVLAFGSPFGLEGTLTQGIVSALRDVPPGSELGGGSVRQLIQTDAPINPGNSGGPLVSARGEVVGVNTAILSRTGGSHGIGFAIPSSHVTALLDVARTRSRELRARREQQLPGQAQTGPGVAPEQELPRGSGGFLGIVGDDFRTRALAGVRIRQVIPGSPAQSAGLAGSNDPAPIGVAQLGVAWTGHIIVAVDGRPVRNMRELTAQLDGRRPGQRAVLTVAVGPRGDFRGETVVTLTQRPPEP